MIINDTYKRLAKKNKINVQRRLSIKRIKVDGSFESDWFDISSDVMKWGKITREIDATRKNKVQFRSMNIEVSNVDGSYNDNEDLRSLWNGYANQQRTQVRVQAWFEDVQKGADGIYTRSAAPISLWDQAYWDEHDWDEDATVFRGVIADDVDFSDENKVVLPVAPLVEVFRRYPADLIDGLTSTGVTAEKFCTIIRDQTDGGGSYIFRPFFGNTTSNFNINSTTAIYTNLNTNTAEDLVNLNVWNIIEKLAEAENYVAYVTSDGIFNFVDSAANTSTSQFSFYGLGNQNREFGTTIKRIFSYGYKYSKYYSRVKLKWAKDDTLTSYQVVNSSLTVSGTNLPWTLGYRTLDVENLWVENQSQAEVVATNIFNEVAALSREIRFSTTYLPKLNLLDPIDVSYDSSEFDNQSLWGVNNWGDDSAVTRDTDLVWAKADYDSFFLNAKDMKILSVSEDLDKLENIIVAKEI